MTEEQLREILERSTRLREDRYLHWENAGGRIECEHGYAAGVACPRCDQRGALEDVPALVAAYREVRAQNTVLRKQVAGQPLNDEELAAYTLCPEHGRELVELRALAAELARELAYTCRHEDSCLEALGVHSGRCSCGYTHADKRAALARASEAGLLEETQG